MAVILRGDREISQRLENFPRGAREHLLKAIQEITADLAVQVLVATPTRTGKLRSEIRSRVYQDKGQRVAGYVSVYAPGDPREYPKAATLEYGSSKPRRILDRAHTIMDRRGRMRPTVAGMTRSVTIMARRYLRGPMESMRGEAMARLEAAIDEAVAEANGGGA